MAEKIKIDPAHPVGSLTAGPQQFTIVADSEHGHAAIQDTINADLALAARNGVKPVILEYPLDSLATLEKRYPELAGAKTWDERRRVLKDYEDAYEARPSAEGQKEAAGIDVYADNDRWKAAFSRGYDRGLAMTKVEKILLQDAQEDLDIHEILDGTFSRTAPLTDEQIREKTAKYTVGNATTPEEQDASSRAYADQLIIARQQGMTIHMVGDRAPLAIRIAAQDAVDALESHLDKHEKFAGYLDQTRADPKFKVPDAELADYVAFQDKYIDLRRAHAEALEARLAIRKDPALEVQRAERVMAAAGSDKALVIWGKGHTEKANDFNEVIDARLQAQAAQTGAPPPAPTAVIELYRDDKSRMSRSVDVDEPDARFYIKQKKLEITPSGADRLEAAPQVSAGQSPGMDEYTALMGRLTAKPAAAEPSLAIAPAPAPPPPPPERKVAALTPAPELTP